MMVRWTIWWVKNDKSLILNLVATEGWNEEIRKPVSWKIHDGWKEFCLPKSEWRDGLAKELGDGWMTAVLIKWLEESQKNERLREKENKQRICSVFLLLTSMGVRTKDSGSGFVEPLLPMFCILWTQTETTCGLIMVKNRTGLASSGEGPRPGFALCQCELLPWPRPLCGGEALQSEST